MRWINEIQHPMESSIGWSSFRTDIGLRRTQNQDAVGLLQSPFLAVVADGMGGHRGGEVASKISIETLFELRESPPSGYSFDANPSDFLRRIGEEANMRILKQAMHEEELKGMGTTTTMLSFDKTTAWVGHVGDSRCYLIKPEGIWQLTRDHSLVQEKFYAGMISREQMKTDRMRNVITRSVGYDHLFLMDVYPYQYAPGDVFLMCSDGLSGPVSELELFSKLSALAADTSPESIPSLLQNAIDTLIQMANSQGGDDNVSVLIVKVRP